MFYCPVSLSPLENLSICLVFSTKQQLNTFRCLFCYMRKKKVSFWATKKEVKPVKVTFTTYGGNRVSFWSKKEVLKPVKVTFYKKKKAKKW